MRGRERDLPGFPLMIMGRNKRVNSSIDLRTVGDCSSHRNFWNCAEGATEDLEWKLIFLEGAKQGCMIEFSFDVDVDISGSHSGGCQVLGSILRIWGSREGKIPPELHEREDFRSIEVTLQGKLPRSKRKGRTR